MAVPSINEQYSGVPVVKAEGGGGSSLATHYSPNDFGADVAQAGEQAGQTGFDSAMHFQGLINETAANNAEASFIKQSGDLKAKYMQYEGLQAEAMRPQYEAELQGVRNQNREGLPLNVQHMYDNATTRTLSYQTSEYSSYSATQVKKANINSQKAIGSAAVNTAGDLGRVLNDDQVGEALGTISHAGNAIADATGLGFQSSGIDNKTSNYTYPDTPEGQKAKAQHLQYTDAEKAKYFLTGAKTVADNMGATAAANWAQKHWDLMPDIAKVQMNQYLAPKVKNETISGNIATMTTQADSGYSQQLLSNVPSNPIQATIPQNDISNVIHQQESGGKPHDYQIQPGTFEQYAKLGESPDNPQDQDAVYGRIINDLKQSYPNDPARQAVAYFSGKGNVAPVGSASPWQIDKQDKNGKSVSSYVSDINNKIQSAQAPQATYQNKSDYLRNNEEKLVGDTVNNYLKQYPDDYYGAQLQERRARTEIRKQITQEDAVLKADRDTISNAINGSLTKGNPPATYEELKALPGIQPLLDKTMQQQGEFFHGIDTMIAKASHRDSTTNSVNGYDTILRTLEPNDAQNNPNRIESVDHLDKLLGDNKGTGINWKDYQDAKKAIEIDDPLKDFLSKNMKQITNANGNLDGKGQDRAIAWYSQVMDAKKQNDALGDKKVPDSEFVSQLNEKLHPLSPRPPSRMQQISNWASSLFKSKEQQPEIPTLSSKDQFDKLPSGSIYMRDGQKYRKP